MEPTRPQSSNDAASALAGRRVLVAEDEMFIAADIAFAVEEAGGVVVGPFATLADTLAAIADEPPFAAILDVNLLDADVDPALSQLHAAGAHIVVNTGSRLPLALQDRFPDVPVFSKPTDPDRLVRALETRSG